ncbi:MAG: ATP-dependent sacrificial sulfur transferase LarE [Eubacteriales bacterium]|jgi:uncharacterized protein
MEALRKRMAEMVQQGLCLAFSGGVDSSLLLQLACEEAKRLGKEVHAVTFSTRLHPAADVEIARRVSGEMGARHVVLEVNELDNPALLNNPVDRCYQCKKYLFERLVEYAREQGLPCVAEGTNADDLLVYRPGIRAIRELGIASPLAELGVTKNQVRQWSEQLGISVAKRPSTPCMATRLPYGTRIDFDLLRRIDEGECFLRELGFGVVRLRVHGEIARVEIETRQFGEFLEQRKVIIDRLHQLGFPYVTMDVEGFRSGSMDIHISKGTE